MLCSAFEMLGWELNYLFPTPFRDDQITFTKVVNYHASRKRGQPDSFFVYLKKQNDGWIEELRNYRDFIIHRGHVQLMITIYFEQKKFEFLPLVLPDNPKNAKLKFERREVGPYCKDTLMRSMELTKEVFQFVKRNLR